MYQLFFFFFIIAQISFCQEKAWEYSVINHLNYFSWDKLDSIKNNNGDKGLEHLIKSEIAWWQTGEKLSLRDSIIGVKDDFKVSILKKLLLGNYFSRQKDSELKALELYKSGLIEAQQNQDTYLQKEIIFRLLFLLKKNSRGELSTLKIKQEYLKQLDKLITSSSIDQFRIAHLNIDNEMQKLEISPNNSNDRIVQTFKIMQKYSAKNRHCH